jgi:hypothetical protein
MLGNVILAARDHTRVLVRWCTLARPGACPGLARKEVDFAMRVITMYRKDMITAMTVSEFHADLSGYVSAAKTGLLTTLFEAFPNEASDSDGLLFCSYQSRLRRDVESLAPRHGISLPRIKEEKNHYQKVPYPESAAVLTASGGYSRVW